MMAAMSPDEIDQLVAGNVRAARARHRITQETLADEMGWSRPTVSTLEARTRRVTLADAAALCAAPRHRPRRTPPGRTGRPTASPRP